MSLEIKNLSKTFKSKSKEVHALNNINLTVGSGEIICVLGHNGAGKTTLIKSICGLLRPDDGYVSIDGRIVDKNRRYAHQHCGAVLEGSRNIYYYLSAYENIRYFGLLNGLAQNQIDLFAEKYLKLFDLIEFRNTPASAFSRGMQQKVAIIIALMKQPDILLLDEPTLGLDIISSDSVIQILKQLAEEQKQTIIITTHDVHLIEELNSRLVFMNHGKIIRDCKLIDFELLQNESKYKITFLGTKLELPKDARNIECHDGYIYFETVSYDWIQKKLNDNSLVQIEKLKPSIAEVYKGVMEEL